MCKGWAYKQPFKKLTYIVYNEIYFWPDICQEIQSIYVRLTPISYKVYYKIILITIEVYLSFMIIYIKDTLGNPGKSFH